MFLKQIKIEHGLFHNLKLEKIMIKKLSELLTVFDYKLVSFDGKTEYRSPPTLLGSKRILKDFKHIPDVLGKKYKKKRPGPWKKKSIFWQLPYWKDIFFAP